MNATPKHAPVIRLGVYNGQDRLGSIIERGARIEAFDAAGRRLGAFPTRVAAAAAVGAALCHRSEARHG